VEVAGFMVEAVGWQPLFGGWRGGRGCGEKWAKGTDSAG